MFNRNISCICCLLNFYFFSCCSFLSLFNFALVLEKTVCRFSFGYLCFCVHRFTCTVVTNQTFTPVLIKHVYISKKLVTMDKRYAWAPSMESAESIYLTLRLNPILVDLNLDLIFSGSFWAGIFLFPT